MLMFKRRLLPALIFNPKSALSRAQKSTLMKKLTLVFLILGLLPLYLKAQLVIEMYDGSAASPQATVAPFEACVGDQIIIYWENISSSQVSYLGFNLKDGNSYRVHDNNPPSHPRRIAANLLPQPTLGCAAIPASNPYCGSFNFTIPNDNGGAVSGPVILYDTAGAVLGSFSWVINNPRSKHQRLRPQHL